MSKEFLQIWRQPRLILTLIVGPFLVLLLFGLGYNADPQPIDTVLVLPRDANMSDDAAAYQDQFSPPFRLAGVTEDRERAADELVIHRTTLYRRMKRYRLTVPDSIERRVDFIG